MSAFLQIGAEITKHGLTVTHECVAVWSGFQMTIEKPKAKQLLRPITTGAGSAMNQSQFVANICNLLKLPWFWF